MVRFVSRFPGATTTISPLSGQLMPPLMIPTQPLCSFWSRLQTPLKISLKTRRKFFRESQAVVGFLGFSWLIMSTSRKRSATARGKAPVRAQNAEPNISRFRDAKATENYNRSLPTKVASTKFVCKPTLISLGVLEGVTQLFRNIGWENLQNLMAHTYKLPTRDFLADCGLDSERKRAAFQLLGDRAHIDFARINEILSLPSSNTFESFDSLHAEFNYETFWTEITGGIFSCAGRNKSTSIVHPCLRIAHRILVCTVFARKEAGQVTKMEIFFPLVDDTT
ncbi:unnamed protein product [Lactuca saligna]|uniref:Arabidopsis retrotransposon Orf1 C-terminal domain-containing protein n=1 Tax=Lactuca saligna TaxID=75948 RepID=A0AA35V608_LACSI|nr:unnamed protein product [Lactuca saligna]